MTRFTRRSLLVGLGSAAVISGKASRVLAQQQDRVRRGEAKTFRSMIPGVPQIRVREVTYQPGGKTSAPMPHSMVCECKVGMLEVSQDSMTHDDEHWRYVDVPQGDGGDGREQGDNSGGHAGDRVGARLTMAGSPRAALPSSGEGGAPHGVVVVPSMSREPDARCRKSAGTSRPASV